MFDGLYDMLDSAEHIMMGFMLVLIFNSIALFAIAIALFWNLCIEYRKTTIKKNKVDSSVQPQYSFTEVEAREI